MTKYKCLSNTENHCKSQCIFYTGDNPVVDFCCPIKVIFSRDGGKPLPIKTSKED